jgi:hypothetical protein
MATPIAPRDLVILLASGVTLPVAAFLAAFDLHKGTKRKLNLFGLILGLMAVGIVASVMYRYS